MGCGTAGASEVLLSVTSAVALRGVAAPGISARNQHGETVDLASCVSRPVLVMFYPFAFSRVCGSELAELSDRWSEVRALDARVLAVSCDAVHTLRAFGEELGAPDGLELLSDFWPHGASPAASPPSLRPTGPPANKLHSGQHPHRAARHRVRSRRSTQPRRDAQPPQRPPVSSLSGDSLIYLRERALVHAGADCDPGQEEPHALQHSERTQHPRPHRQAGDAPHHR